MNDLDKSLSELGALIAKHEEVQNQIFCHYVKIVNAIVRNEITSEQVIKKIMDGLFDFSIFGGGRFFRLYRKLCFHVYYYYPQLESNIDIIMLAEILRAELPTKDNNSE